MAIIIPAAGEGSRFAKEGYALPKPLIRARGVPMIRLIAEMSSDERIIIVCQEQYEDQIHEAVPTATLVPITKLTEGAALSVLCAESVVQDDEEVTVINSDNLILGGIGGFLKEMRDAPASGGLMTFKVGSGPWSYARTSGDRVTQVAEKVAISDNATAGVYNFASWRILRTAICKMVAANDRYNGEFYLAPVYNYMIGAGLNVRNYNIPKQNFVSLGTPSDLELYNALA